MVDFKMAIDAHLSEHKKTIDEVLTSIISEISAYSNTQYRRYKDSTNLSIKNDPWVLGKSEGADDCIELIKKYLTSIE